MKDVLGYEGLYGVTSCGRIWGYKRKKFLKPFVDKDGYLRVALCKEGKRRVFRVHRLVAEAYLVQIEGCDYVNHIDEVKSHNWLNNLEWCSSSYNAKYGTRISRIREKAINNVKNSKPVQCVETGEIFQSLHDAARCKQLNQGNISRAAKTGMKCGNFHWVFLKGE